MIFEDAHQRPKCVKLIFDAYYKLISNTLPILIPVLFDILYLLQFISAIIKSISNANALCGQSL